jgi:hypothetical protein
LGQWDLRRILLAWVFFMGVALGLAWLQTRPFTPESRHWRLMTLAMLGPGSWGMILGWWADMGFAAYHPLASCCSQADGWWWKPFVAMPWMYSGMLLLGIPPMLGGPVPPRGLTRLSMGLLSSIGMVWGMAFGNRLALQWLQPQASNQFLVSFAGMTVGMLLGMFFCCELGRAISLRLRARAAPGTPRR